jgi:acyl carrier protein
MSEKETLIKELREIIKPYVQNQEAFKKLSEDTHFITDLEINSANLVDIVLDTEDKYDIEIDNESMDKMSDVKSAMEVIQDKIAAKG